jgi:CRP/FNR family transcriptional regulator
LDQATAFLSAHPYLCDLDAAQVERLARAAVLRHLARGEILALEGDPSVSAYFIIEGRIRALKSSAQGREQIVEELTPGQLLYLVPLLDGGPLPVTTQAATRATLLGLARETWLALLHDHPDLVMTVLREFALRLRRLTALVEDLSLRSVPERLARLLLTRATAAEAHRLTQREMAAQLGTVREVLARTLAHFEQQGWVRLERGVIEITDASALRALAGGASDAGR